jgi:hypothetical protein
VKSLTPSKKKLSKRLLTQPQSYLGNITGITRMAAKLSLKEFVWSSVARRMLPSQQSSEREIADIIRKELSVQGSSQVPSLSENEKEEVSLRLGKMIRSEAFWDDLGKEIGPPRTSESENAFVERAKAAMANLIRIRMKV